MVAPRTYSPNFDTVTQAADAALNDPDGITIRFKLDTLGSMEACRLSARSFQKSFTALRARANRLSNTSARDTNKTGIYSKLICQVLPMGDDSGWMVNLLPARVVLSTLDIISNSTGLPITSFGAKQDERTKLTEKSVFQPSEFTAEDYDRLTQLDAAWRADNAPEQEPWHTVDGMLIWKRPGSVQSVSSPLSNHAPVTDLADLAALPSVFGVDGGNVTAQSDNQTTDGEI